MAFEGVLQWAQAVILQAERLSALCGQPNLVRDAKVRHQEILARHTECHFFAIAAHQLIEYRNWALKFGLFPTIDFTEINQVSASDIRDLRNMREHVVEYFQGCGHAPTRWVHETPDYKADASSLVGSVIGGRLDWRAFAAAVQRILPELWAEPVPYPQRGP